MGRLMPTEGIYWGDHQWLHDHRFTWFPDNVFAGRLWPFGKPEDHQSVKLTNKISERVSIKPDGYEDVGQAVAVYHAQVLQENEVTQLHIIVMVFLR